MLTPSSRIEAPAPVLSLAEEFGIRARANRRARDVPIPNHRVASNVMRWSRIVTFGALFTGLLAGCGGNTTHSHSAGPTAKLSHAATGFARGLLRDNELRGFLVTRVTVATTEARWIAALKLLSGQMTESEMSALKQDHFVVGAQEALQNDGAKAISAVEQFATPAAARGAIEFEMLAARSHTSTSGGYTRFTVAGIPGAIGFASRNSSGPRITVAFSDGDYYYMINRQGSGRAPIADLTSAARSLYRRQ